MVSTYTTNLRLDLQGTGDNNGTWGTVANTDFSLIDTAIAGYYKVSVSGGDTTLSTNNGSSDIARNAILEVVGSPTSAANIVIPANSKIYFVKCSLSNSEAATIKVSGTTGYTLVNSANQYVITDGTTVTGSPVAVVASIATAGTWALPRADVNVAGIITSISEAVSANGLIVRTGVNTYTNRSVSAGAGVAITNPAGSAGDITVALSAVATSATNNNPMTVNYNSYGQIISTTSASAPRVYEHYYSQVTAITLCSTIPSDNTVPQNTEGTEIWSQSITPMSASSKIRITVFINGRPTGSTNGCIALFKDSNSSATAVGPFGGESSAVNTNSCFSYEEASGSTSARTYRIRIGCDVSFYLNGTSGGGGIYGGVATCYIKIEEII